MTEFSIDYFIKKFKSLPPNAIGQGSISKQCALFHCGLYKQSQSNDESKQLAAYFRPLFLDIPYGDDNAMTYHVNDATFSRHWIDDSDGQNYDSKLQNKLVSLLPKERLILCLQIVKHHKDNPELSIIECINLFI